MARSLGYLLHRNGWVLFRARTHLLPSTIGNRLDHALEKSVATLAMDRFSCGHGVCVDPCGLDLPLKISVGKYARRFTSNVAGWAVMIPMDNDA